MPIDIITIVMIDPPPPRHTHRVTVSTIVLPVVTLLASSVWNKRKQNPEHFETGWVLGN